jgi:hypothetical protein
MVIKYYHRQERPNILGVKVYGYSARIAPVLRGCYCYCGTAPSTRVLEMYSRLQTHTLEMKEGRTEMKGTGGGNEGTGCMPTHAGGGGG